MPQSKRKKRRSLLIAVILLLVLAACSPQSGGGGEPVEVDREELVDKAPVAESDGASANALEPESAAPTDDEGDAEEVEVITEVEPPPAAEPREGVEISTVDDRSDRLRFLTSDWNTDWTRHSIDYDEILSGGPPRDGIPSIDDPVFISPEDAGEWLADNEPVMAVDLNGEARAYPLQILTWHEVVNDEIGDLPIVVTFCPLCNSAIVFDRRVGDRVFEFGTSGLLRNSDLIMYDRTTESLWQQFTGEGIVGEMTGVQLRFLPSSLVSFADFKAAFPDGLILSRDTGFSRNYGINPYAGYDDAFPFLFDGQPDDRLRANSRVVTVSFDDLDVAYPLEILAAAGVINDTQGDHELAVFHTGGTSTALGASRIADGADVGATGVFVPRVEGVDERLTFTRGDDGVIRDDQTGSEWNILGHAVAGELAGARLQPVIHGDHFWFSWAAFQPDTIIYAE